MDGRWLTALALGALAVAPRVVGSLDRRVVRRGRVVGMTRHVATKAESQVPSARDLVRAVERRDEALEESISEIPVVR